MATVPTTKIRFALPAGMTPEEALKKIEFHFHTVEGDPNAFKPDISCCVDVTVVSPVSTVGKQGSLIFEKDGVAIPKISQVKLDKLILKNAKAIVKKSLK